MFIMPLHIAYESAVRWRKNISADGKVSYTMSTRRINHGFPTGALSIGSFISKHIHDLDIKILDANTLLLRMESLSFQKPLSRSEFFEACFDKIGRFSPDIIGFTCMFNGTYNDLRDFAAAAQTCFPRAFIVAGGHLAAAVPDRIFSKETAVRAVCFGEGEIPFLNLCRAFIDNRTEEYLREAISWITAEKQAAGFVPRRELIEDLSEIPPFNLNMLVFQKEFLEPHPYIYLKEERKNLKEIMLFPTRGCPYHCIFCSSQNVHGHEVRTSYIECLKDELLYYNKEYGITSFVFFDDYFLYKKDSAVEILNFIADRGWHAETPTPSFYSIDDDIARAMARAGIKAVEVNIENGNQETLTDIIHKPSNLKRAERTVASLRKHGIMPIATVLLGFPGETIASMMKGINYLKTTDFEWFLIWIVTPLPGSELWDMCLKEGYSDGTLSGDYETPEIETKDFSKQLIAYLYYSYNKWLNFENNRYFRRGEWKKALDFFEEVSGSICNASFLNYYYMALCAKKNGDEEKFESYRKLFLQGAEDESNPNPICRKWIEKELKPL